MEFNRIYVISDLPLATNKAITALANQEAGAFGILADGTWSPVASNTTAEYVALAIGNSSQAGKLITPVIKTGVKNYSITTMPYTAEVLPKVEIVIGAVSGIQYNDSFTVRLEFHPAITNEGKVTRVFEIVGTTDLASPTAVHAAIANVINTEFSDWFTAVATGATKVAITAKQQGVFKTTTYFENPNATGSSVTVTSVTASEGTVPSGTPAQVKELLRRASGEFGSIPTLYSLDRQAPTQAVSGTKYTIVRIQYKEDKPTDVTINTDFPLVTLDFACDVSAVTPSSLVSDLETFFNTVLV